MSSAKIYGKLDEDPANPELNVVYTLISSDGQEFKANGHVLKISRFLYTAAENLESVESPIHIHNVKGAILAKVLEWCEQHIGDEPYELGIGKVSVPHWDYRWLRYLNGDQLLELVTAAFNLEVLKLMDYGCKRVSMQLREQGGDAIRKFMEMREQKYMEAQAAALNEPGTSSSS